MQSNEPHEDVVNLLSDHSEVEDHDASPVVVKGRLSNKGRGLLGRLLGCDDADTRPKSNKNNTDSGACEVSSGDDDTRLSSSISVVENDANASSHLRKGSAAVDQDEEMSRSEKSGAEDVDVSMPSARRPASGKTQTTLGDFWTRSSRDDNGYVLNCFGCLLVSYVNE